MSLAIDDKSGDIHAGTHDGAILTHNAERIATHANYCHNDYIWGLAIDDKSQYIVTASHDGSASIRKLSDRSHIRTLTDHSGPVTSVDISKGGHLLATGSMDFDIAINEIATGKKLGELIGHSGFVEDVEFHPNGELLVLLPMELMTFPSKEPNMRQLSKKRGLML